MVSLVAATPAFSQGFGPFPKGKEPVKATALAKEDMEFIEKAMIGGMVETELAKTAQTRATHPQVKQFGARMFKDHNANNEELRRLATSKGVTLPYNVEGKERKDIDNLRKKVDVKSFDREYMEFMVKDHKEDIAEFEKAAKGAKDPDVKAFAAKTLPTLHEHLKLAQETEAAAKGAKK